MRLTVTKIFEFHYSHYLPGYSGKCKNLHGHTGILEVEVGPYGRVKDINEYEGMVIDFSKLKEVVKKRVIDKLDHAHLNNLLHIPTAENIAKWVWDELEEVFGQGLIRVRVYETPTSYAECRR